MTDLLAITGATGYVGGAVARQLSDAGANLRLVVRDPDRAPAGLGEVAQCDFGDREAAEQALRGADVLFMVSASEAADRRERQRTFIDAAVAAGVRQVVYLSFLGAGPEATFTFARDHWAAEEYLRESGMDWTFLRDSFYLDLLPTMAEDDGAIKGPAGDGRVGAVARDDVVRTAAAVLGDPTAYVGAAYDVTGPQALSLADVARITTEVTGRAIRYQEQTVPEAYESRRQAYGVPDWQLDGWVSTYTAIASGEMDVVTDTVERLTGTPPLSLADLLRRAC